MFLGKSKIGVKKCLCDNNLDQCGLVLELRKSQEEVNKQRALVEYYKNSRQNALYDILKFIQRFKEIAMFNYAGNISSLDIIDVICSYSTESIDEICNSLKLIKNYSYEISNAEYVLDSLNEKCTECKNKLGIE